CGGRSECGYRDYRLRRTGRRRRSAAGHASVLGARWPCARPAGEHLSVRMGQLPPRHARAGRDRQTVRGRGIASRPGCAFRLLFSIFYLCRKPMIDEEGLFVGRNVGMAPVAAKAAGWIGSLGALAYEAINVLGDVSLFAANTLAWMPRRRPAASSFWTSCYNVGVRSLPVVAITGTFI